MRICFVLFLAGALGLTAQTSTICRPGVRASGEAVVSVPADQARLNVGVVTQAATAEEAGAQNAEHTTAVIGALRAILGKDADIHTTSYTLNPVYHSGDGSAPMIVGYGANNTLQVRIDDLTLVGRVLDSVTQSGANTINGIAFAVRDEQSIRLAALKQATVKARANAQAIASALGVRVTGLQSAETADVQVPRPMLAFARTQAGGTPTPVEPGAIEVHATVQVTLDVSP